MSEQTTRLRIDLEGTASIRQLAALLKALLRRGGWKCVAITRQSGDATDDRTADAN